MVSIERFRYQYRVDRHDCISWVNSWWLAFARENGGHRLTEQLVVGRSLWDFIADDETRQLYQALHYRLRGHDSTVVLPLRCDSPNVRRHMQLIITGKSGEKTLMYEGGIVQAKPREYLAVLDSAKQRTNPCLWMCSCCKHVLLEPKGWIEVEEISEILQLNRRQRLPRCRQTLCPHCRKMLSDSVN